MENTLLGFWLLAATVAGSGERPKVILHADDFGMSHSANRATMRALDEGIVTSASIMVPCPWILEVAEYSREHPDKDLGIHLTLTSEWKHYRWGPVSPVNEVPSLVDDGEGEQGYFPRTVAEVHARAKKEHVRAELRAQIQRAIDLGIRPTHIDSHMGALFSRPDLFRVYLETALEFDVPPLIVTPEGFRKRPTLPPGLIAVAEELLPKLRARGFPVIDEVDTTGTGLPPEEKADYFLEYLAGRRSGVAEIIIHCGYDDDELRAITRTARRRQGDMETFTDAEFIEKVRALPVELTTWRALRRSADAAGR